MEGWQCTDHESNPRPLDHKSDAPTTTLVMIIMKSRWCKVSETDRTRSEKELSTKHRYDWYRQVWLLQQQHKHPAAEAERRYTISTDRHRLHLLTTANRCQHFTYQQIHTQWRQPSQTHTKTFLPRLSRSVYQLSFCFIRVSSTPAWRLKLDENNSSGLGWLGLAARWSRRQPAIAATQRRYLNNAHTNRPDPTRWVGNDDHAANHRAAAAAAQLLNHIWTPTWRNDTQTHNDATAYRCYRSIGLHQNLIAQRNNKWHCRPDDPTSCSARGDTPATVERIHYELPAPTRFTIVAVKSKVTALGDAKNPHTNTRLFACACAVQTVLPPSMSSVQYSIKP